MRDGIPGLSDLPGVGRMFGHSRDERTQTDIILMLTPRIVRVLELTEEDLRAFQMGTRVERPGAGGRFRSAASCATRRHRSAHCPAETQPPTGQPGDACRRAPAEPAQPMLPPAPPPLQPPPKAAADTSGSHAPGSVSDRGARERSRATGWLSSIATGIAHLR